MTTPRVPVSFIATSNVENAAAFYGDVIGLELVETSPYALVFRDGGHTLRVQIIADITPVDHTAHGWVVENIDHEIKVLRQKNVTFLIFDALDQDSLGVWTTPAGDKIAWFKDPCGNVLSFTEYAQS